MAATTVVAWIGAVSGLSGLAWDFYKWKTSGPKLSVSVTPGMKILERGKRPLQRLISYKASAGSHLHKPGGA